MAKTFLEKINFWFVHVSRGYSVAMSVLNWLIVFVWCLKLGGDIVYGLLALVGLICAHLGANVFDDYVDYKSDIPKQRCQTYYLTEGLTTPTAIFQLAMLYFVIAGLIGVFLTFACGLGVLYLAVIGGIICLLYPKLNNFCLGELALGLAFSPLLSAGVSYVMLKTFDMDIIFVSLPVMLFTLVLLIAHALMDYDFDKECNKRTFCTVLGSKDNALYGLFTIIFFAYLLTVILVGVQILSPYALLTLLTLPIAVKLYKSLKQYITVGETSDEAFMRNFKLARDLSSIYMIILVVVIFFTT